MPLTRQQKKDLNITDLEAYTMASKEAINAKFEAFENRIDEKIRSLFAKFSMGRPSSPKKSQQGETSDWKDDSQERGATTVHSYGGDFLRENPRGTTKPRSMKDKGRASTSHGEAFSPLYCHLSPCTKQIDKR
ncbi:hypothetical protein BHE74_00045465 [Ensete ventricosum]|nr:hypothetical protein BHE74_00045465 [Ensete ventricosum]